MSDLHHHDVTRGLALLAMVENAEERAEESQGAAQPRPAESGRAAKAFGHDAIDHDDAPHRYEELVAGHGLFSDVAQQLETLAARQPQPQAVATGLSIHDLELQAERAFAATMGQKIDRARQRRQAVHVGQQKKAAQGLSERLGSVASASAGGKAGK